MKAPYTMTLSDSASTLETVGGKGLSLSKMLYAGMPVPPGFHITTEAYRRFIQVNDLQPGIMAALQRVDPADPASLERASVTIRQIFDGARMPTDIAEAIRDFYEALGSDRAIVAIRSSATAEDLPVASFAGQQETYLNISGIEAVLESVKKCWASLWTARAIAYRIRNRIDQNAVALAVVVQEMVDAQSAGILFTANPMNGRRDEMVINAAWGLGEALVGGLVSPDTLIVDKRTGRIKKQRIAEKTVITLPMGQGTQEQPLTDARRRARVLSPAQVIVLAQLARGIEDFHAAPQDIEWCHADGRFYIVQARPITALPEPELPARAQWKLPKGAYAVMRNNIVELMPGPLSPLFATLGLSAVNTGLHRLLNESFGMQGILPADILIVVNHYAYNNGSIGIKSLGRLMFGAGRILKMMFTGAVERWTEAGRGHYFETVEAWQLQDWRSCPSVELVSHARKLTEAAIAAYGALISGVIPAAWITEAIFTRLYERLLKRKGDPVASTYLLGYDSLPIQADKSLFRLAQWSQKHAALAQYLQQASTQHLAAAVGEHTGSPAFVPPAVWKEWRRLFHEHLQRFGHALYDLDFAHALPIDDPAPVLDTFKLYLRGEGGNPYARQQESESRREQAVRSMQQRLRGLRLKWFNKYLALAQRYAPLREDGLAEIGLAYPLIRQMLHELGRRFAQQQVIECADDIFWLTQQEVLLTATRLDSGLPVKPLVANVSQQKTEHQAALKLNPPMMLPQMKVFGFDLSSLKSKRGRGGKGNVIKGVAASPGSVTGLARILRGPEDFSCMQPGEVLVAPITTPAWTPLFAMASAIVTDVGGPLSHGSIVAREYGIPAVLGTGIATRRIHSGQMVTVDGSEGKVFLGESGEG